MCNKKIMIKEWIYIICVTMLVNERLGGQILPSERLGWGGDVYDKDGTD